jgi:hypothetical protein
MRSCPTSRPFVTVPTTIPATLPSGASATLIDALSAVPQAQRNNESVVGDAVRLAFAGTSAQVSTAVSPDGVVGVAVQAGKGCIAGRLLPVGGADVWSPPAITVSPGELGCSISAARAFARGEAKQPPH